ncbi:MAG: hypothetical protein HY726_09105 [Candidatus Rokubacteria bacterium]|nr:hypothetical protein [Candidatus Rokubacteria bacterium]
MALAEILIALTLIVIGLLALAQAMQALAWNINQSSVKTKAVFLAQQRLEQVKNRVWWIGPPLQDTLGVSLDPASAPATFPDETYGNIPGYPNHRRAVRIIDCGAAPGCGSPPIESPALRLVTVSVSFRPFAVEGGVNATGEESLQVTTLVARR